MGFFGSSKKTDFGEKKIAGIIIMKTITLTIKRSQKTALKIMIRSSKI